MLGFTVFIYVNATSLIQKSGVLFHFLKRYHLVCKGIIISSSVTSFPLPQALLSPHTPAPAASPPSPTYGLHRKCLHLQQLPLVLPIPSLQLPRNDLLSYAHPTQPDLGPSGGSLRTTVHYEHVHKFITSTRIHVFSGIMI